ncbi:ABC transporter permease [Nocardia stercoris]|uniref:ABC transporter permease n=1 Tax=Nocardia stercoris TaxID=2483361 RepID=A0A3M2LBU2_9NOCA|nr:ABC transporter permease [Nocardia stercoris]RMI35012.1 ABC transporter permease [Nocardia stercoris]
MTTTLARPDAGFVRSASEFTGTGRLLRLYLRRDRIVLPLWVLLLSLPLGSVYVTSTNKVYSTPTELESFRQSILNSPAELAMYGPMYNISHGAAGVWKAGMFHAIIAIATILTVIRHTRAEEESGREELLAATRVGRLANLTAALLLACGAAVATGVVSALSISSAGVPLAGSLAFGLAEAGAGVVFATVAAVTAQLSASARTARGIGFAVLATAFLLRAVGDMRSGDGPANPLTWLSPLGWSLQVRPFAGDRWWVLSLHVVAAVLLTLLAYALLRHRDLGAGLLAERLGPPTAGRALTGPIGLAWRLQRGTIVAWTIGFALYGTVIGSVVHGIGDQIGSSKTAIDVIERLGGTQRLEDAVLVAMFTMLGLMAAGMSISSALRLSGEENADRAEPVLAAAVGRIRWATSHLLFALAGPALALLVSGLCCGVVYGIAAHDVSGKLGRVLGGALVQLPAVWVFTGLAVAGFGLLPRRASTVWGLFVAAVALYLIGSVGDMPQGLLDLNPFAHLPKLPGGEFAVLPVAVLLAIAAALITVGLYGFRRRDLR